MPTTLTGAVPLLGAINQDAQQVAPVSISSGWTTLTSVLTTATSIVITTPVGSSPPASDVLAPSTTLGFYRIRGIGTNVCIRVVYDKNGTAISTALTYRLWGRETPGIGPAISGLDWQVLPNRNGDKIVTPVFGFAATDPLIASTHRGTIPSALDGIHDSLGCDEFFIEIVQGIVMTGATDSLHKFQVKII